MGGEKDRSSSRSRPVQRSFVRRAQALFEQGKESVAAFRRRFIIIDANPKKIFELATE